MGPRVSDCRLRPCWKREACPGCSPGDGWVTPSSLSDRVQKEQLAAIFKLLKDNKDTFGEMSDYDVQEQLRLYDM